MVTETPRKSWRASHVTYFAIHVVESAPNARQLKTRGSINAPAAIVRFGNPSAQSARASGDALGGVDRRLLGRMIKHTVLPVVASLSTLSGALKVRLEQFGSGILIALAALLVLSGQLVVVALVVLRAVMVHQVRVITNALLRRKSQGSSHPSRADIACRHRPTAARPVSALHESKHRRDFS